MSVSTFTLSPSVDYTADDEQGECSETASQGLARLPGVWVERKHFAKACPAPRTV